MQVFERYVSPHEFLVFAFEILLIPGALILAVVLQQPAGGSTLMWKILPAAVLCQLCLYYNDFYDLRSVHSGSELVGLRQPSMASAPDRIVGSWGNILVSLGLIVSVLGAYLAWSLISIEVLFAVAKAGDMPRLLARENANGVPAAALWHGRPSTARSLVSLLHFRAACPPPPQRNPEPRSPPRAHGRRRITRGSRSKARSSSLIRSSASRTPSGWR